MDESCFRKIVDSSPDMYVVIDGRGLIVDFIPFRGFQPPIGPSPSTRKSLDDLFPADLAALILSKTREALHTGNEAFLEFGLPLGGTLHFCEASFTSLGENLSLVIIRDVTEMVRLQGFLEEKEEQNRHLFEKNPVPMFVIDMENLQILDVNIAAVMNYGYGKDEFRKMFFHDIRPPDDAESTPDDSLVKRETHEKTGICRHLKKNGTPMKVDVSSYGIHYNGRKARLALCRDVTDQLEARKTLEESEEKFRKAFLLSSDAMSISRIEDGALLEINEGFTETTGYKREEAIGKTPLDLGMWVDRRRRHILLEELTRKGRVENFEFEMRVKNGVVKNALLSTNIIHLGGIPRRFSITRDITELKKTQQALQKSEEQLRASLGEKEILLKEIHHRVKNNLQIISGFLDLQGVHLHDPRDREKIKESQNRILTMALIHQKLYRSKNLSGIDFSEYLRDLCENLMVSYGVDRDRIKLDVRSKKTLISLDLAITCGLIINELITNSIKYAFPEEGKGTISISFSQGKNGDYLLTLGDDGIGIPENTDIFRKDSLGIQLVAVLIEHLGGTIRLVRGDGTRYRIRLKAQRPEDGTRVRRDDGTIHDKMTRRQCD